MTENSNPYNLKTT